MSQNGQTHFKNLAANVKILHSRLFQGKYLFAGRSTYLLVKKDWGSSHFPVNNYWGVLSSPE